MPSVRAVLVSLALSTLAIGASLPVTTLLATDLAGTTFIVGVVVASRWVTRMLANLPAGAVAERHGAWRVFRWGIAVVGVTTVLGAVSPTWPLLLVSRALEGVGAAMSMTAGMAFVAGLAEPERRGRLFGHYQLGQRTGYWFGPLLGGVVASAAGLRVALWAAAAVAFAALLPLALGRGRRGLAGEVDGGPVVAVPRRQAFGADVRTLLTSREFLLVGLATLVSFAGMTGAQYTALPVVVDRDLGQGPGAVGAWLFAVNALGFALVYPMGFASDRFGRRPTVAVLLALTALGFVVAGVAGGMLAVATVSVVLGFGQVLRGPATQAYAIDAAGSSGRGAASALYRTLGDVGSAVGPVVAGWLLAGGAGGFFVFNGVLAAAVLVAFVVGTRPAPKLERGGEDLCAPSRTT